MGKERTGVLGGNFMLGRFFLRGFGLGSFFPRGKTYTGKLFPGGNCVPGRFFRGEVQCGGGGTLCYNTVTYITDISLHVTLSNQSHAFKH